MRRPCRSNEGRMIPAVILAVTLFALCMGAATGLARASSERPRDHLQRAKVFLAAGDYRRALEAC